MSPNPSQRALLPKANVVWSDEGIRKYESADISKAGAIDGWLVAPAAPNLAEMDVIEASHAGETRALAVAPTHSEWASRRRFSVINLGIYRVSDFPRDVQSASFGDPRSVQCKGKQLLLAVASVSHS